LGARGRKFESCPPDCFQSGNEVERSFILASSATQSQFLAAWGGMLILGNFGFIRTTWPVIRPILLVLVFIAGYFLRSPDNVGRYSAWELAVLLLLSFLFGVVVSFMYVWIVSGYSRTFRIKLDKPRRSLTPFGETRVLVAWLFLADFLFALSAGACLRVFSGHFDLTFLFGLVASLGMQLGLVMGVRNFIGVNSS
jgi:hypothetical protein